MQPDKKTKRALTTRTLLAKMPLCRHLSTLFQKQALPQVLLLAFLEASESLLHELHMTVEDPEALRKIPLPLALALAVALPLAE